MIAHLLKNWRRQIPVMDCEPGCRECCEGYAPAMTKWEWQQISHPGKYATGEVLTKCPFLAEAGCEIYLKRPLICRLFGTVAGEDAALQTLDGLLPIACPRGRAPDAPLVLAAALQIQVDYQHFAGRELLRIIDDWQRYLPQAQQGPQAGTPAPPAGTPAPPAPALPEKFRWLRYVLSTRDGQATLRLLWGAASGTGFQPVEIDKDQMTRLTAILGD